MSIAGMDTYCNNDSNCIIDCASEFMCTDRNILIDPTIVETTSLSFGTLSGYGTNINIGFNNHNLYFYNSIPNASISETIVDSIEVDNNDIAVNLK